MGRSCPDCGASLEDALVVEERLDDLGYKHRDRTVECPECPRRVTFGIPVEGDQQLAPRCEVCGGRTYPYKLDFHRVTDRVCELVESTNVSGVTKAKAYALVLDVHWKCEDCHYRTNGQVEHLTEDVYSLGVSHLEGRRE